MACIRNRYKLIATANNPKPETFLWPTPLPRALPPCLPLPCGGAYDGHRRPIGQATSPTSPGACDVTLFANLSVANVVTDVQNCIGSVVAGGAVPFVADIKAALQSATDAKDGTAMACLGPALAIATAAKPASADGSTPAVYPGPVLIFQKYREFVTARRPVELQDRRAVDHQRHCGERAVMVRITEMQEQDIRRFVGEVLAEQTRLHINETDEVIFKAIATILTSFGIDKEDRRELRADFQHLRRWRKSVEQAQSYTLKAVITVIVTGLVGAVWLGVKVMLSK
jgi:hypothetical protein